MPLRLFAWGHRDTCSRVGRPELVHAINEVLYRSYITLLMTKGMVGSFIQNLKRRKTRHEPTLRQKEVLQLLAEGRSMKEVAYLLNVTPRTVPKTR